MKRLMLTLVYIFFSFAFIQAQIRDTSKVEGGTPAVAPPHGKTHAPQYHENTVIVESHEIPESLRSALLSKEYKGWENSTIYHDRSKNHYTIRMNADSTVVYRFDQKGKRIKDDEK